MKPLDGPLSMDLEVPFFRLQLGRTSTLTVLRADDDNFRLCYLELVYKPKYQFWCESDVPCA